ncbi:HFL137Wp [Eremothecium sinecaudum]|uniref:HFL137Wp n=1 Tax=Eremothecium sinecaudum TaxID=45286 RepID=A0A0X8HUH6_9SACH|nr:HFL137Wp [Eremothecium sinecaudum]AMD21719.1 HFL137Wp [Eremothecium sinecaudum]
MPSKDKDVHELFLKLLCHRDTIEKNFSHLFTPALVIDINSTPVTKHDDHMKHLRRELRNKEIEVIKLQEIVQVGLRDKERLNDEIIGLNIENSLLQDKLDSLQCDYDKLIKRWLLKAQNEADAMNQVLQ